MSTTVIAWDTTKLRPEEARDFLRKAGYSLLTDFTMERNKANRPFIAPRTQIILAQDAIALGLKRVFISLKAAMEHHFPELDVMREVNFEEISDAQYEALKAQRPGGHEVETLASTYYIYSN
jgi:hypothetical protein